MYDILKTINSPADVKKLNPAELETLAADIREALIAEGQLADVSELASVYWVKADLLVKLRRGNWPISILLIILTLFFRFRFPTIQDFGSERWQALPGRT